MVDFTNRKYRILMLEGIHPVAHETLRNEGFEVVSEERAYSEKELIENLPSFDAVGIRSKTQITAKAIAAAPNLLAAGAFCIGTNQVALEDCNKLGIPVFNAPYSNTRSVAELVIAETIALSRQLCDRSAGAHQGQWMKSAVGSNEIRGKTMGIVGYGHIGSQVAVLAEALGMSVIYFDIIKKLPLGNSQPTKDLEELLAKSDFVTFHVPETDQTKNMVQAKELKLMKKGSYLLNLSRGSVVNIEDLASSLREGHLCGAAIDVFPSEPKSNKEAFATPLAGIPNVILTPHIGGSTEEAQQNIGYEVSESLAKYLNWGSSHGAVNFPEIDPPKEKCQIWLFNVHQNVPGVLGEINSIVSNSGLNIRYQNLATDSNVGYLVMGLEGDEGIRISEKISSLKTSIKTRAKRL